ncbi:MAG: blue light sensor protein [Gammaproteobacteria bacterium]|jgi:hypothetical protein|nr:blue light sensor protein [Gammaproteobacteria bacterium]
MPDLIELVYASRSNVTGNPGGAGVEPEVGRILYQSRRNNARLGIGGVLCFGNDTFFQCLEGEREAVEKIYNRLHDDPRHREVTLLRKSPIASRRFRLWAMKYLTLDRRLRDKLKRHGYVPFDPFGFDDANIEEVLELLRESTEAPLPRDDRPQPGSPREPAQVKAYTAAAGTAMATFAAIGWLIL